MMLRSRRSGRNAGRISISSSDQVQEVSSDEERLGSANREDDSSPENVQIVDAISSESDDKQGSTTSSESDLSDSDIEELDDDDDADIDLNELAEQAGGSIRHALAKSPEADNEPLFFIDKTPTSARSEHSQLSNTHSLLVQKSIESTNREAESEVQSDSDTSDQDMEESQIDDEDDSDDDSDNDDDLEKLAVQASGSFKQTLAKSSQAGGDPPLFFIDKKPMSATSVKYSKRQSMHSPSEQDGKIKSGSKQSDSNHDENAEKKKQRRRRGKKKPKSHPKGRKDQNQFELTSSLQVDMDTSDVYVNVHAYQKPKEQADKLANLLLDSKKEKSLMKKSVVGDDFEKNHTVPAYQESVRQKKKRGKAERENTKGDKWFDMRAPEMTEEKKNDLMVIQMRQVLDPKAFYKGPDIRGALPKFFQMGRVVDNPVDFYHNRVAKKQRKATLVEELLADAQFRQQNKRKYAEIVESRQRHSKGAFKHMKRLKKKK